MSTIQEILQKIKNWATNENDIRALILIGSLAGKKKTDELSDFDVSVFSTSSQKFLTDDKWMLKIGKVIVSESDEFNFNGEIYPTRLIIFEDGVKIDFAFYPITALEYLSTLDRLPLDYDLGYKILLDKDGLAKKLSKPTYKFPTTKKPTQEDFTHLIKVFFFEAYHVAKYFYRNDLWLAKFRDWATKELLLKIIEWHEKSKHGWDYDTYDCGKKMESWVASDTWNSLQKVFGHYDSNDGWKAFIETMSLFREIAQKTAKNLQYNYPSKVDQDITIFANKLKLHTSQV